MIPGQSAGAVGVLRRCVVRGLARARRSSPVVSRPTSPHGIPVLPVLQYPHPQVSSSLLSRQVASSLIKLKS